MSTPAKPVPEMDDEAAELEALKAAIAESDADPRFIPHEEMREWLLKLANGDFKAPPPVPRKP
jgi:hypothetical protein